MLKPDKNHQTSHTPDQLYMVQATIQWCRSQKYFWLADFLRKYLVNSGWYFKEPKNICTHNPRDYYEPNLRFSVDSDGVSIVEGSIYNPKNGWTKIYNKL